MSSEYLSDSEYLKVGGQYQRKTKDDHKMVEAKKVKVDYQQAVKQEQIHKREIVQERETLKWQQKAELMNKMQYLSKKLPHLECKYDGKCLQMTEGCCSHCWWNNITIPYEDIQECKLCAQDVEKYKEILSQELEDPDREYRKHEKCSRWCLWHDYFFAQVDV